MPPTKVITHINPILLRLLDKEFRAAGLDYCRRQDRPKDEFVRDGSAVPRRNLHLIDHAVNVYLYFIFGDFTAAKWEKTAVMGDITSGYKTSSGDSFRTTLVWNPPYHSEPPLKDNEARDAAIEGAFWPMPYADEVAAHRVANEWLRLYPGDIGGAKTAALDAAKKALNSGDIEKIAGATIAAIIDDIWTDKVRKVAAGDINHGVQGKVVCSDLHVWVNARTTSVDFSRRGTSPVEGEPIFALRFDPSAPTLEECWWLEDEHGWRVTAEETRRRVAAYRADKDAEREAFKAWNAVIKPVVARGTDPFAPKVWGEAMGRVNAVAYTIFNRVFSPEEAAKKADTFVASIDWRAKAAKLVAKRAARRS